MTPPDPTPDDHRSAMRRMRLCALLSLPLVMGLVHLGLIRVSHGAVTVTQSTVTFAWNPSAGAEGYYLVYAPFVSEPFQGPFTGRIDVGDQTRVSFEIWEGAAFHVAVQAYNDAGTSQVSNVVSFIRPAVETSIPPLISIRANGSAGPLTVSSGTPVTLSVDMDRVGGGQEIHDVWLVADTPFGLYSYRGAEGWVEGLHRYEGLFSGSGATFESPNLYLPVGAYTFYLAVDNNADRQPDGTWWEAVGVEVTSLQSWWSHFLDAFRAR